MNSIKYIDTTVPIMYSLLCVHIVLQSFKWFHFYLLINSQVIISIHDNIYLFLISDVEKIKAYIDSFRYGCPPHAGGGIGKLYYCYLGRDSHPHILETTLW